MSRNYGLGGGGAGPELPVEMVFDRSRYDFAGSPG